MDAEVYEEEGREIFVTTEASDDARRVITDLDHVRQFVISVETETPRVLRTSESPTDIARTLRQHDTRSIPRSKIILHNKSSKQFVAQTSRDESHSGHSVKFPDRLHVETYRD